MLISPRKSYCSKDPPSLSVLRFCAEHFVQLRVKTGARRLLVNTCIDSLLKGCSSVLCSILAGNLLNNSLAEMYLSKLFVN